MKGKKIISMLLALCMVLAWLPETVRAEGAVEIAPETVRAEGAAEIVRETAGTEVAAEIAPDTQTSVTISTGGEIAYLSFTPQYSESYTFYSTGDVDTYGYLYDADRNVLTSNDDGKEGRNFSITYALEAGVTYIYGARFYSSSRTGTITVSLQTNHAYQEKIIFPATCTEKGQMEYTCDICGYSHIGTINPGHSWGEDKICSVCGTEWYVDGTCRDNLNWYLSADGVLTISGSGRMDDFWLYNEPSPWSRYSNEIRSVVIEDGVTSIGEKAFSGCSGLTSITIPEGVTSIGNSAFDCCSSLTSVTIPEGVTGIGGWTFRDCSSLTSITLPESLTIIGYGTFYNCSSLTGITIPEGVTGIGMDAFNGCSSLTGITIPEGVTSIGSEAFANCTSLTGITIPDSVTSIDYGPFAGCSGMTRIDVASGNLSYRCIDGVLMNKRATELICCPGGRKGSYAIPESVTSIGDKAFCGCSGLTGITIPDGVTSIGYATFCDCNSLTSITIPDGVPSIGMSAFNGCSSLTSIMIPDSVTSIGSYAFFSCSGLADVYYGGSETEWLATDIDKCNASLTNATIHYNSAGPENGSGENGSGANVRYFTGWDAENQIAYFDDDTITGSQVTNETDTSFLENVESLVGQYVLVETRPREDSMIAPDTLISIKSVETKTGTVTDADTGAKTVTIDGVAYNVTMSRVLEGTDGSGQTELVDLSAYVDEFVLYHIYDGKIVGIETLQTTKGMLTYWDAETRKITITHEDGTTTTYTLSELADADTVSLLGETGYFEFDVVYVTDGNSFLYRITRAPAIDFADGYVLRAYFDRRELTVQCDEEMEFVCALFYDGLPQEDWSKPAFTTSNENVLSVTECEKTDSGYCLKVKGGQPGTATITVTDADSGAYVDFTVEVREEGARTYSYLIDEVPSFYPDVWGDRDTQTNFYNVNGLYVNDFPKEVYKFDGKYRLSFTVYNSTNMYGSVDVYDENGNWYSSQRIDKHTSITGLWDTAKGAFFLLYDKANNNLISYTSHSFSTPTEIDIEVPEGGYFTISNNFVESPGTYIYNSVDFMMIGIDMLTDLAFSSSDIKGVQEQAVNQILQTPDAYETFLVSFKDIAQGMVKEVTKQGYGDAVEAFTLSAFGLFEDMQFDFMGVVELACNSAGNVAEGVFEKCTPPVIGGTLKGMFAINKYYDRLFQVMDVCDSKDRPYIRLYTPEATGSLTISGITAVPTEGALPDDAVLQVFRVANTEALIISDEGLVANQYELYNIAFTVNNVETQPNGTVTVKIPVPANYNSEKCIVLHQQEDGNWRTVESRIEQGFIVFEVDHFCQFAVVDTSIPTEEYTPGDINGDGAVNNKDLTRLFQYLSGYDVEIEKSTLDVNGDGAVNNKDLTRLFQFLSGWDVEIN